MKTVLILQIVYIFYDCTQLQAMQMIEEAVC